MLFTSLHTAVEEGHETVRLVDGHCHLCEAFLHDGRVGREYLFIHHAFQFVVLRQPQLQFLTIGAM